MVVGRGLVDEHEREAEALLTYVLGCQPSSVLKNRYRQALVVQGEGVVLNLHAFALWCPALLRLIEPRGEPRTASQVSLARRLNIAMALVETSTEGVDRMRRPANSTRLAIVGRVFVALALDLVSLPILVLCRSLGR